MPIALFEALSAVVVVLTLVAMAAARPDRRGTLLLDYVAIAIAGWVGEDTCIQLYRYYTYADSWHLRVHHVPLLVPLIWPLVILSARDTVEAVADVSARDLPLSRALRVAALVALVVVFDAALIEVLSVRAGYWWWAEPGHQGVPPFGILGWGFFAFPAIALLSTPHRARHLLVLVLAPLVAHGLIVATWWLCFRWVLRHDLGAASLVALGVGSVGACAALAKWGSRLPISVAAPRLVATALFAAVFWLVARDVPALWICLVLAALPYWASMAVRPAPRAL